MISLVAISDSGALPPPEPLRAVSAGSLCALCAPADGRAVTVDTLVEREELLEALMEDRDVLPVQFGTALPDESAAAQVVLERHEELAAALDRVRGAVELAASRSPRGTPGRRACGPRQRSGLPPRTSRRLRLRRSVSTSGWTRSPGHAVVRPGPDLLHAAYLVDHADVARFVAEVKRAQESCPELSLLCTGPWPPFSFAGAEPTS